VVPFAYVLLRDPGAFAGVVHYGGESARGGSFQLPLFGAALTVGVALITQMGEQADYLRFMPASTPATRGRWWLGVLVGGPGWVVLGVLKMLGGALLAWLAISHMVPVDRAVDPNQMYLVAYAYVFPQYGWAVAATALFVVVSQMKINVTNAYAGSLAWSNFFSRLTHSHPGRVVWVVFNTLIAFMLMEMNVFQALGEVLGLYANIAIAWIMAVVADLVINKPLGLSPKGIEFKRAHLYDINPVGVGAMALASALSVAAHMGVFGDLAQAFSASIAMVTAFVAAPLIAWATKGRYYIARTAEGVAKTQTCVICERDYEGPDMAHCPAYQGAICSLCCTLDARCGDLCKPQARLSFQWGETLRALLPRSLWPYLDAGLSHYLLLMAVVAPILAAVLGLMYHQQAAPAFIKIYATLLLVSALVAWWLVLAHKSREVAQEESNRQTRLLMQEIESHRRTDEQLQQAKRAADLANQAKTRYISTISHELRTPLNSILGYAQLLQEDTGLAPHRAQAIQVIHRGGEHLLSLIEGTLDIARIESGKLTLDLRPMRFPAVLAEVAGLFELQAQEKGLRFRFEAQGSLPLAVRADEKRVRQILINLLGNAVKFTSRGEVALRVRFAREMAHIEVMDTGPGMTAEDLQRVFEPFARGSTAAGSTAAGGAQGSGLGLTIAKMLTDLMGGEMSARSAPGEGTVFTVRLFLPELQGAVAPAALATPPRCGYGGPRRRVLVVDNEEADRDLIARWLLPLGFEVTLATHGEDALRALANGLRPDAVCMDLAMPGIDGWETLRRIRALALLPEPALAVVSANAFDKGLDNDIGLPPRDFLVKPVRRDELLDWLGQRLGLVWQVDAQAATATVPQAASAALPTDVELDALLAATRLGYYKGIVRQLDELLVRCPDCAAFAQRVGALARAFRFEAIEQLIAELRHDTRSA
ncbi:MAG: ATP-binding protein, partial [Hydrogenophaga sp.]|nr:ATP-binding protein [Hydrogenophaga sp.]